MLTVREVAEALHVHPQTVHRWCDEGLLPFYQFRPRGRRRFKRADVLRFIESHGRLGAASGEALGLSRSGASVG